MRGKLKSKWLPLYRSTGHVVSVSKFQLLEQNKTFQIKMQPNIRILLHLYIAALFCGTKLKEAKKLTSLQRSLLGIIKIESCKTPPAFPSHSFICDGPPQIDFSIFLCAARWPSPCVQWTWDKLRSCSLQTTPVSMTAVPCTFYNNLTCHNMFF